MSRRPVRAAALAVAMLTCVLAWSPAVAKEHVVSVTSSGFEPAQITVKAGDSVRWVWVSGSHTITSGESPTDDDAGKLIDAAIHRDHPEVIFAFPAAGVFDYFSRPAPAIRGTVTVQDGTPVDEKSWGFIKNLFERPA